MYRGGGEMEQICIRCVFDAYMLRKYGPRKQGKAKQLHVCVKNDILHTDYIGDKIIRLDIYE